MGVCLQEIDHHPHLKTGKMNENNYKYNLNFILNIKLKAVIAIIIAAAKTKMNLQTSQLPSHWEILTETIKMITAVRIC